MKRTAVKVLKRALAVVAALFLALLAWRAYDALRAPHLARWHTFVPDEASAARIAQLDWAGYLDVENKLFEQVRADHRQFRRRYGRRGRGRFRRGLRAQPRNHVGETRILYGVSHGLHGTSPARWPGH